MEHDVRICPDEGRQIPLYGLAHRAENRRRKTDIVAIFADKQAAIAAPAAQHGGAAEFEAPVPGVERIEVGRAIALQDFQRVFQRRYRQQILQIGNRQSAVHVIGERRFVVAHALGATVEAEIDRPDDVLHLSGAQRLLKDQPLFVRRRARDRQFHCPDLPRLGEIGGQEILGNRRADDDRVITEMTRQPDIQVALETRAEKHRIDRGRPSIIVERVDDIIDGADCAQEGAQTGGKAEEEPAIARLLSMPGQNRQ